MARRRAGNDGMVMIERPAQIRALAAPLRQEMIDTLQSLGQASVAEIARQLGRRADSLYYHLNALVRAGIIRPAGERRDGTGRPQALYETAAPEQGLGLRYPTGKRAGADAVRDTVAGMLRTTQRDFAAALADEHVAVEGPARELWAARGKGWLSPADLKRANALLVELSTLFRQTKSPRRDRLFSLTYVLTPDARQHD